MSTTHAAGPVVPVIGGVAVRAVGPGDAAGIGRLLVGLDADARYRRWFGAGTDLRAAVAWAAAPDPATDDGLVAMFGGEVVGHAVLAVAADGRGEVAFEVAAAWRRHGIAGALLAGLEDCARTRGLTAIYAEVLGENRDMLAVLREHAGFHEHREGGVLELELALPRPLVGAAS